MLPTDLDKLCNGSAYALSCLLLKSSGRATNASLLIHGYGSHRSTGKIAGQTGMSSAYFSRWGKLSWDTLQLMNRNAAGILPGA